MRGVRPVAWLALVVATGVSATTPAQTDDAVTDVSLLSLVEYGYAGEDLESRSVQVYRIPVGIGLRDEVEHGWGLKLMLPVSIF